MSEAKQYVYTGDNGALRIGKTRVSLDSIVYAYLDGHSAESIQEQFPAVSLEEVYGAIAYYLGNRKSVQEHLARQEQRWEELRREIDKQPLPVVQRLRALRRSVPPGDE